MQRAHIVIPAYKEAARLPGLLADIKAYLRSPLPVDHGLDVRFCIVDGGSPADELAATERALYASNVGSSVTLLSLGRNRGKGAAIRAGFERALNEGFAYQGFMDADSSVPVRELHRVLVHLATTGRELGLAGTIGSRVKMLGRSVVRNPLRHCSGRVFATFVAVYFRCAVYDTQCGLKVFDAAVLPRYLDAPIDTRWVWDTQLLLAMLHAGERIHEIPIDWRETGDSKVSLLRDPLTMIRSLIKFKRRLQTLPAAPLASPPQAV
jgi:glycosyltransferase involved in cell wall biosynthesis